MRERKLLEWYLATPPYALCLSLSYSLSNSFSPLTSAALLTPHLSYLSPHSSPHLTSPTPLTYKTQFTNSHCHSHSDSYTHYTLVSPLPLSLTRNLIQKPNHMFFLSVLRGFLALFTFHSQF